MASKARIQRYRRLNGKYLRDAELLLQKGDYSQASEKFWSAAAGIAKAVAGTKGIKARTHGDLWEFVIKLDKEHPDLGLAHDFYDANHLHSNFYEDELRPEAVLMGAQAVRAFVKKMERL